ncbi:HAMP domain-containing sensor histidine kinase [Pararhizobium sp. IMCC21322]|uniref:sensor histidine kinase n=1 Tax=Pararhizobium sp. IMCC21322 TaxID=3067903 RepID=UPI00274094CA|nr:HAMP domain-containing sensor histidine kinase [Pararhizobium sp. IMCC21322]
MRDRPTKRSSIARNLAFGLTGGLVLFCILAVAIGGYQLRHELDEGFDEALQQAAIRLLPLAVHDLTKNDEQIEEYSIEDDDDLDAAFTYVILNSSSIPVIRSGETALGVDFDDLVSGFTTVDDRRLFSIADAETGFRIVVIESTGHRGEALLESVFSLLLPLGALVPLAAIGIWIAIRRSLKPLDHLRAEIEQRDSRDLSPLSVSEYPEELSAIKDAIAALMERLRLALEAERTFAANSAHELRTPLAGALAQVQRLSIEMQGKKGSERLQEIDFSLRHLSNLSEQLLQLSRLDAGFARSGEMTDLSETLAIIVRDFQADSVIHDRLVVTNTDDQKLTGNITKDAFAIVLRNLIQNAFKHGVADGTVTIDVTSPLSLTVMNEAGPISEERLEQLGEPFQRGTTTAEGTGLGLSIVRSVMKQCDGSLRLRTTMVGARTTFEATIRFEELS